MANNIDTRVESLEGANVHGCELPGVFARAASGWVVLACKAVAELETSSSGTCIDPWQVAGETSAAPDGTNDESWDGVYGGEYLTDSATEPGHAWPFMSWGATLASSLNDSVISTSTRSYFPACRGGEEVNHYRRFCRLAPGMFGSSGRLIDITMSGTCLSTQAADCMDIWLEMNLTTACSGGVNSTALDASKAVGFRFSTGVGVASESPFVLRITGQAMGPTKSVWMARLTVGASGSAVPLFDETHGPVLLDLSSAGISMDTDGALLAFLFAARDTTAAITDLSAGGARQDGTDVFIRGGAVLALLSPGL